MRAADLHRFFVVCSLVSDLYCPGYNPKQSLEKHSNLARTAVRYKIDSLKIATAVREELSRGKHKTTEGTRPAKRLSTASTLLIVKRLVGHSRRFSNFSAHSQRP